MSQHSRAAESLCEFPIDICYGAEKKGPKDMGGGDQGTFAGLERRRGQFNMVLDQTLVPVCIAL